MDIEMVKRGLRGEIKKREKETYGTCETNIRQMCIDCLATITDLEAEVNKLKNRK